MLRYLKSEKVADGALTTGWIFSRMHEIIKTTTEYDDDPAVTRLKLLQLELKTTARDNPGLNYERKVQARKARLREEQAEELARKQQTNGMSGLPEETML